MSSKPQAPLTAHLRKRFRPTSEVCEEPKRVKPKVESHPLFMDNDLYEWVKITPEIAQDIQLSDPPEIPIDGDDGNLETHNVSENEKRLCHVLEKIVAKHESENRFLAMTAKLAIRFVNTGRTDIINPGLWLHIREMEEELQVGTEY
ncbi:hypothetical protein FGB62_1g540 [Gracilaria domingensis]|nr:hypothetical protein FGB62_1g540 [Gracilaria domingensis]